jgi:hypothetical protein
MIESFSPAASGRALCHVRFTLNRQKRPWGHGHAHLERGGVPYFDAVGGYVDVQVTGEDAAGSGPWCVPRGFVLDA